MPVQPDTAVLAGPLLDGPDEPTSRSPAACLRRGEQILQVAHVGRRRAGVDEEMSDADQPAVERGAEGVDPVASLELIPGVLVALGRPRAPVERVVAAEQRLPERAIL